MDVAGVPARRRKLFRHDLRADQHLASLRLGRFIVDQDVHLLDAREVANDLRVDPRNGLELARPVGAVVRPRDPGGLVRLPLGRHAIAERGRCVRKCECFLWQLLNLFRVEHSFRSAVYRA